MVGGLQGENGDLDIKKSKEKYLTMSVATIRKLQENTRALCKIAAKFSQQKADFAAVQKSSFSLE